MFATDLIPIGEGPWFHEYEDSGTFPSLQQVSCWRKKITGRTCEVVGFGVGFTAIAGIMNTMMDSALPIETYIFHFSFDISHWFL